MVGGVLPWLSGGDCRDILIEGYNGEYLPRLHCGFGKMFNYIHVYYKG